MLKYRPDIDGMRSIAIIPVVLFHCGFHHFSGGYIGVDVFFVLSGYLITSIITKEIRNNSFSILKFYERRARRILPALFLVLTISVVLANYLMIPEDLKNFHQSLFAVTTFSSNILFWLKTGYFDTASELKPLLHTWSLAVEEQYYLLFPLLLIALKNKHQSFIKKLLGSVFFISLFYAVIGSSEFTSANFYLLPSRLWEILAGSLIALYPRGKLATLKNSASLFGLGLIIGSVFLLSESTPFPGLYALPAIIGTVLVIYFSEEKTVVHKILASKPMVKIGLISYSTYLWHQVLISFYHIYRGVEFSTNEKITLAILPFCIGFLSWKYIEAPFRNKERIGAKSIFILSITFSIALGAIGLFGHFFTIIPNEILDKYSKNSIPKTFDGIIVGNKNCSFPTDAKEVCQIKGTKTKNIYIILGDSHARVLTEPFFLNKDSYLYMYDMSASGCPFFLGLNMYSNHEKNNCTSDYQVWRSNKLEEIRKKHKDDQLIIVLQARLPLYYHANGYDNTIGGIEKREPYYASKNSRPSLQVLKSDLGLSIKSSIEKAASLADKLYIVLPTHTNGWNVINRSISQIRKSDTNQINLQRILEIPSLPVRKRRGAIINIINKFLPKNGFLIDPTTYTCSKDKCYGFKDGYFLFSDTDHPTLFVNDKLMREIFNQN
jgi:peptidoglycan/LPS O-acetylase OafA/YrhL